MKQNVTFKRDCILKDLQILLWGILAILFALLLVLESVSFEKEDGITVKESIAVSSALINKNQQNYTSAISGILYNPTDDVIRVESVSITVKGGDALREVELGGFLLPPRTQKELYTTWEGFDNFTRVTRVAIRVDGENVVLANVAPSNAGGGFVIPLLLLAIAVFLLIRAVKGRYYLWQESQM